MTRMLWSLILIPAGVYIGLSVLLLFFQHRFIFFPVKELEGSPKALGLAHEEVWFTASDGLKLHGWFIPAENPRGTLLFCHGNAGNISHRLDSIRIFNQLGLDVFIFDYRGYGLSEGRPTEEGTYRDAEAAWGYLVEGRGIAPSEIVLFGRSLGGAIAAWLAQERSPAALILESAFTSVSEVGATVFPYLPISSICRFGYQTKDYLKRTACPVLVVHSLEDEMIPFRFGKDLFGAAPGPKKFLEIRGGHNDGFFISGEIYVEGLKAFLGEYLTNKSNRTRINTEATRIKAD